MSAKIVGNQIEVVDEITSLQIAQALKAADGTVKLPTDEQRAIIESKYYGATVIIAGAGSGKTETMTQRVLWLIVNGVVTPQEILGLTFTRKAAGEFGRRVRERLRELRRAKPQWFTHSNELPLDISVDVATYHSYAGRIMSEHGIRMGIDTDGEPLGEAAAWQMTDEIVNSFEEVQFSIQRHKPDFIVNAVMSLSGELGEHDASIAKLRKHSEEFHARLLAVTVGSNELVRSALETIEERLSILPMVERVNQRRIEVGQLTFNDQMSYAAKLVQEIPAIAEIERAKYKVVLLDEYQDTSYSQVRFLSGLYGDGHCVTGVGDPNQAIYGWRGASPETMGSFQLEFGGTSQEFNLLTTWRNDQKILDLANKVVSHIGTVGGRQPVVKELRARPGAGAGSLSCGLYISPVEEAAAIADYMATLWNDPLRSALDGTKNSTFAVLVRVKSYIPLIESALRARGMNVEVIGLGGLIHIPEIADIIATLRLITFPDAGTALARLLVGPRLALGPKDLAALGSYSKAIARKSNNQRSQRLEEILESGSEENLDANDFAIGSIIEALELIEQAPQPDFSRVGIQRLKDFSREIQQLRRAMTGSITDQIHEVERFLRLDVEVLVRDGWQSGRRHLDKFLDEATVFQRTGGSLSSFLNWLETAEVREGGLKPVSVTASNTAIQILTIHAAKGAEWDVVAVPGLVEGVFPNTSAKSSSWIKYSGSLPIELRGDSAQFSDFKFPLGEEALKAISVSKAITRFEDSQKSRHRLEELRLGYVAFTRAKSHLFGTASWFRDGKRALGQSELFTLIYNFLEQNDASGILSKVDQPDENPFLLEPMQKSWPVQSERVRAIQASAQLVANSPVFDIEQQLLLETDLGRKGLLADAQALLKEAQRGREIEPIYLPQRLSVSTLIALKEDPLELVLSIRRPMPRHSDQSASRGNQFHQWVERQFGLQTLFDDDLFDPAPKPEVALEQLQTNWLASSWSKRTPIEVEAGFETVIAGIVIRGRIDAVYKDGDTYEVVDWKTGRIKEGEELESATIQLAMYRLAYSKLHKIPIENIRAAFFYVADNQTIYRDNLSGEAEIATIINSVDLDTN
jgi:DNA helicase-2/ATP-dependent DNA helicase PcrA